MIATRQESPEVLYPVEDIVSCNEADWSQLKALAMANHRQRIRLCMHRNPEDSLQEMLIVHTKDTYVRPHKHEGRVESFSVLEGIVDVILFEEDGAVQQVVRMGPPSSGERYFLRMNRPIYHSLVIHTDFLIFHEATTGPFSQEQTVFPAWAKPGNDAEALRLLKSLVDSHQPRTS
jgi:cupin fold WbuC family metalloprotein